MNPHNYRNRRLSIEFLEQRTMLAADPGWAFALNGPVFVADSQVAVGPDENVYVAGSFRGTTDFDPGPGTVNLTTHLNAQDGFVAKYTPQGALLWVKQFGQSAAPVGHEYVTGLEFDAAGNLYLAGHSNSVAPQFGSTTLTNQGSYDVFVTKLDSTTGSFLWTRGFGGVNQDTANGMTVSPAGDVYVTGSFFDTVDFDPGVSTVNLTAAGASDAYVAKLDSSGNLAWARQFGSSADEFGHRVAWGNDGNVYAVGTFRDTGDFGEPGDPLLLTSPTAGTAAIYLVSLDEITGDTAWCDQIGGTGAVTAARIAADGAGNLFVAGRFANHVSFDSGSTILTSAGGQDGFVARFDNAGNFAWADQVGRGAGNVVPGALRLDAAGNPLVTFGFDGTADFDPGPAVVAISSTDAANDGAVVKLNADGSFAWVRQMSGPGVTEGSGVWTDSVGNVYVTGSFTNSASLSTGHQLTNSGNATFVMKLAQGEAPTKFYVVDDAANDRTYEYQASSTTNGNYAANSGNSAPRGAASTMAGDRVWVVDANRKVYVYDINGNLLGSWSAGTMASNATPEGIATNGTDVWIVDSKSDKVYKYAGAASRVSGSQNAASSFNLNSGNKDAKDIVTDGASLWVVNDSTTDKVFKYTVAGSLVGSWTIAAANSQPTGITIDPANVSDIWIVDNGTDRVYQYSNAASRTAGSQSAAASFALAAGNSNPQGIADPPPSLPQRIQNATNTIQAQIDSGQLVKFWSTSVKSPKSPIKASKDFAQHRVFEIYSQAQDKSLLSARRPGELSDSATEDATGPQYEGPLSAPDDAIESAFEQFRGTHL